MQNFIFLILAVFILIVVIRMLACVGVKKPASPIKEVKHNVIKLLLGIVLCTIILVIPYQIWMLTGSSHDWDAAYIIGATAIITVVFCFYYYYKRVT
ncbi:hypothetical protein VBD025_14510 [Virgibacillus flavescens]|uniref:hypothetical protein n=1 Tax=Virgibacillus flavescens TaxID=1611422 RepID=UPI003D358356